MSLYIYSSTKTSDSTLNCKACCSKISLAPAGIMTDHVHEKNKLSAAYGVMLMNMAGNQSGKTLIDNDVLLNTYAMIPKNMSMQMHMLMFMYGISNRLTVMTMFNYNVNQMAMCEMPQSIMNMSGMPMPNMRAVPMRMLTSGLGDTKLFLLYNILSKCNQRLVISAGINLPSGRIDYKGITSQSTCDILSYNMQIGCGTYNILPSAVYVKEFASFSFGNSFQANIKSGLNNRNYAWGNDYNFSTWGSVKFKNYLSFSARGEYYLQEKLIGWDNAINQSSGNDPSCNANNYGEKELINLYLGMNLIAPSKQLNAFSLQIEYGKPLYQKFSGIQMPIKNIFNLKIHYNF